jgi:F-type H+-transporting ATPase subunit b
MKVYKSKIEALESEVDDIKAQARRSAEADKERILEEARESARKIEQAAVASAEREAARLKAKLEAEVVDEAMAQAEALIRKSFQDTDQRRLVDDYVKQIDGVSLQG